ncbi:MAG TPA: hypothetical protein VG965_02855 [Patescibacteria group bacterium]|nr:hypothetical protein [Patescibacteria group bacterium]
MALTGASPLTLSNSAPVVTLATAGTDGTLTIKDAEASPNTLLSLKDNGTAATLTVDTVNALSHLQINSVDVDFSNIALLNQPNIFTAQQTITTGGLLIQAGGADITGGIENHSGGITNAGAITGITYATASGSLTALTVNATSALQLNGANINTTGTLSNVAYKGQNNNFTTAQTIGGLLTVSSGGLTVSAGGASINGGINNNSGNITSVGSLSGVSTIDASGLITLSSSTPLTLTDVAPIITLGAPSVNSTLTVKDGDANTLITLTDTGTTGDLSVTGNINATSTLKVGNADINATGTLTNVAYKGQNNNFTTAQTIGGLLTVSSGGAVITGGLNNTNGNITNAGFITGITYATASGTLTLTNGNPLALTSTTPNITLGASDSNSTLTIKDTANTPNTLLTLADNGTTGTLTVDTINAASTLKVGNADINATGTLTNVAYKGQNNNFTTAQTIGGALSVTSGGAAITGGLNNNSGGITNAGSVTGITYATASGTLTLTNSLPISLANNNPSVSFGNAGINGTLTVADADTNSLLTLTDNGTSGTLAVATINATSTLKVGGADINATGTLTNVAYKGQNNNFTTAQTIGGLLTVSSGGADITGGATIHGGIDNTTGGITNTGTISGATGITSSGTISFTGLGTTGSLANQICIDSSNNLYKCGGLQTAYNLANTITTTDARDVSITLADTATDSKFLLTNQGNAEAFVINDTNGTGTNTSLDIQQGSTPMLTITETGVISVNGGSNAALTTITGGSAIKIKPSDNNSASGFGGDLNLLAGDEGGTTSTGGSVSIDAGTGTNTNGNGTISLGTTNAQSIGIGSTGKTTTNNGFFTSTQTLTASNGFTQTTGALNLTSTSGSINSTGLSSATMTSSGAFAINGAPVNINTSTGSVAIGNSTSGTSLAFTSGATVSQTFTSSATNGSGTSSDFVFNANGLNSGNAAYLTSNTITTGSMLTIDAGSANTLTTGILQKITNTSTAGTTGTSDYLLQLSRTGANAGTNHSAYGISSSVSTTNSAVNIAGYFDANGSGSNYGLLVDHGNAGFGTLTPTEKLVVGAGNNYGLNLNVPAAPSFTTGSGSLGSGTYYYKITALDSQGGETIGGAESSQTVGASASITLSWTAIPGASSYRIYRGTSSGSENTYYTSTQNSFTDTGAAGTGATPPTTNTAFASKFLANGSAFIQGNVTIGPATQTTALLSISGGNGNNGALIVNNINNGDLIDASASGVTKFSIKNDGTASSAAGFVINNAGAVSTTRGQSLTIGGSSTGFITIDSGSNLTNLADSNILLSDSSFANCGSLTTVSNVLTCGGSTTSSPFKEIQGKIIPLNSTEDFFIGGQATSSAKFAVLGANTTTPTASVSAQDVNNTAIYLDPANGALQTVRNQTLNLGGTTTGNIQLKPGGSNPTLLLTSNGSFGFGTTTPLATLDLRANLVNGGTIPVASTSGKTSFASFVVDQSGVGDVFVASRSGAAKFIVNNGGTLQFTGGSGFLTTLNSIATAVRTITFPDASGTICVSGQTCATSGAVGYFQRLSGALSPSNITDDLLLGGVATSSARISFINSVGAGTPTINLGLNGTTNGILSFGSSGGSITPPTLASDSSGNITLQAPSGTTILGSGAGNITVDPGTGGNQIYFLLAKSGSGTGDINIQSNGSNFVTFEHGGSTTFTQAVDQNISINASTSTLGTSGGGVTGGVLDLNVDSSTNNTTGFSVDYTSNSGATGSDNLYAQRINLIQNSGAGHLYGLNINLAATSVTKSGNSLVDCLLCLTNLENQAGAVGDAIRITGSAASGGITNGINLNGATDITNDLVLQNGATIDNDNNGTLRTTGANLDVRAGVGTTPIASFSGKTSFAGLVVDNNGRGDIFTASNSGVTRFTIAQNGSVLFEGSTVTSIGSGGSGNGSTAVTNALGDEGSLVPNAGFESMVNGGILPDGWKATATTSATFSQDNVSPVKGNNSLKVVFSNTTTAVYSPCIPLNGLLGSYTLNYYAKITGTPKPTVRAYVDGYSSQANCQSDTSNVPTAPADTAVKTTSWVKYGTNTAAVGVANSATWGRVHFYFACTAAGALCTNATVNIDGVRLIESDTGQGLDYAENYPADPNNTPVPGDVVALEASDGATMVVPANSITNSSVIGIVSTNPGQVLDDGSISDPKVPVALSGRVPVSVSTSNGDIHVGDYLAMSALPGVAVKATQPGTVIGTALEDYTDGSQIGKVNAFVNVGFADPENVFAHITLNNNALVSDTDLAVTGQITATTASIGSANQFTIDSVGNATTSGTLTASAFTTANGSLSSDAMGNVISKLNSDTNGGNPTQFKFQNSSGTDIFTVDSSGNAVLAGTITTSGGTYDLAEDYPTSDNTLEAGDVVSVDTTNDGHIVKSTGKYDNSVIGIYSEKPGFKLSELTDKIDGDRAIPVALAGRVPVKVVTENGAIHKGDYLTSSSTPGVAMKSTQPGQVIGKALSDFDGTGIGKVTAFVNVTFADPTNSLSDVSFNKDSNTAQSVSADNITLPADLQINGQTTDGKLSSAFTSLNNEVNSIKSDVLGISTKISDLDLKVTEQASSSAAVNENVNNISDKVASNSSQIDVINSKIEDIIARLSTSNSTPSGSIQDVLSSGNPGVDIVKGENITNQDTVVNTLGTGDSNLTSTDSLISTDSAQTANVNTLSSTQVTGDVSVDSVTVHDALRSFGLSYLGNTTISGDVTVSGQSYLADTNVLGALRVDDSFSISRNSINVESQADSSDPSNGVLYLQNSPLASLVDIFNGGVVIDNTGSIVTKGDVHVGGDLQVDGAIVVSAKAGENIHAKDILYISDSGTVKKAYATDSTKAAAIGIAQNDAKTGEQVKVIVGGKASGFKNLQSGKPYYLAADGTITTVAPISPNYVVPVGTAFSDTELLIQINAESGTVAGASTSR